MKKILFITGNKRKMQQANTCLEPLGIRVEQKDIDIDEIQSHEPIDIAIAKAEAAFAAVNKPLVICDHFWSVNALKGFPGGYMKDINLWFEAEDWLALMKNKRDRSVLLTEIVVYIDELETKQFIAEFPGHIIHEVRGIGHVSGERVTVFDDGDETKTIAEHIDAGEHARDLTKSAWQSFGEWFSR